MKTQLIKRESLFQDRR